jgi:hypothetical protein
MEPLRSPTAVSRTATLGSLSMLDLLYIFLSLAVFAAFAVGIRAADRL